MKPHGTYFIINRSFLRISIKQLKNGDYNFVYLTIVLLIKQVFFNIPIDTIGGSSV